MVHNYGKVHNSSHPNNDSFILKFVHEDLHNSFVTFKIDASNLLFVYNVGKGRIVETYSTDVQALSGMGELTAEIQNTGEVTAEFSARGPHDLSYKYLLIPSIRVWPNNSFPEQYTVCHVLSVLSL